MTQAARSPISPRFFSSGPLAHSTEHLANSSGLIGCKKYKILNKNMVFDEGRKCKILTHLPMHWAKSTGFVIRSPRSPRSSEPLAHSTEHLANSSGLMGCKKIVYKNIVFDEARKR